MSGQHSLLAPSKAHRWVACPGSIKFCAEYPEDVLEAAEKGTRAHELCAMMLRLGKDIDWCGATPVEDYSFMLEYVHDIRQRAKGKMLFVEQKVLVEPWTTELGGFGTSDAIIFDPESGHLEVRDLKFGMIVVMAEENEQLMLYALGCIHLLTMLGYEVKTVTLAIHQPRRQHYDEWPVTLDKLNEFGAYACSRGRMALDPLALPGDHLYPDAKACEYCPAKMDCPPYNKKVQELLYNEFTVVDGKPTAVARPVEEETTPGELDLIESWVKAKRAWILEQLQAGVKMKSWKLVEGRAGNRKFTDLEKVERLLKGMKFKASEYKETSLIPLTQIETLVGKERWKKFLPLVKQAPGSPQMAPMTDKRKAISSAIEDEFGIVEQEEFHEAFT